MEKETRVEPVWGAHDIGIVINQPDGATFRLLEGGLLPARKVGDRWLSTRGELEDFLTGRWVAPSRPPPRAAVEPPKAPQPGRMRGRPKGSRNRKHNKTMLESVAT